MPELTLANDGAAHFPGLALELLPQILALAGGLPTQRAGHRLHDSSELARLLGPALSIGALARSLIGDTCRPVRAILFDKTESMNWSLGWHQDRTICVQHRAEQEGFGPWTLKQGIAHVAPPISLLERMFTLRIHLDDVTPDNAPLLVALGSHREGLIAEDTVGSMVARSRVHQCLAEAGDVWAYSTLILHASQAAHGAAHRRVLQVDFSGDDLPGELEWLGI